jgi:hypothetical protein
MGLYNVGMTVPVAAYDVADETAICRNLEIHSFTGDRENLINH